VPQRLEVTFLCSDAFTNDEDAWQRIATGRSPPQIVTSAHSVIAGC
jgi:hypothetical protein